MKTLEREDVTICEYSHQNKGFAHVRNRLRYLKEDIYIMYLARVVVIYDTSATDNLHLAPIVAIMESTIDDSHEIFFRYMNPEYLGARIVDGGEPVSIHEVIYEHYHEKPTDLILYQVSMDNIIDLVKSGWYPVSTRYNISLHAVRDIIHAYCQDETIPLHFGELHRQPVSVSRVFIKSENKSNSYDPKYIVIIYADYTLDIYTLLTPDVNPCHLIYGGTYDWPDDLEIPNINESTFSGILEQYYNDNLNLANMPYRVFGIYKVMEVYNHISDEGLSPRVTDLSVHIPVQLNVSIGTPSELEIEAISFERATDDHRFVASILNESINLPEGMSQWESKHSNAKSKDVLVSHNEGDDVKMSKLINPPRMTMAQLDLVGLTASKYRRLEQLDDMPEESQVVLPVDGIKVMQ